MKKDILSQVLLTQQAWNSWHAVAAAAEPRLLEVLAKGLIPADIPDEQAEALPDGRLRIHVTLPDGTVLAELTLLKGQWGWMQG